MFTGIIQEIGTVTAVRSHGNGVEISVAAPTLAAGLRLGDSIAVDGVCQTVTDLSEGSFSVQAVATTLGRTTLGRFAAGRRVNLEPALALGERLGGHLVQGHVDGVGEVLSISPRDELILIGFSLPDEVAEVTVLHGSIALNGISLTVNDLPEPGVAQVSIIPFTREHTNLADLRLGDGVNLEGDMLGKFVRRLLHAPTRAAASGAEPLNEHLLRAWGY